MVWGVEQAEKPIEEPVTTYGPFPCKAIPKILTTQLNESRLIVFNGGLPRASYGDRYTVSCIHDTRHVVFEFTSKVIDFLFIDTRSSEESEDGEVNDSNDEVQEENPVEALVVLAEEEIVVIDLLSEDWKMMALPYLVSLHASAVTCSQHISGVPEDLWEQLKDAGKAQTSHLYSNRTWPINGGKLLCGKSIGPRRELLLTGHEDGTVRFWDAGSTTLTPIYKFSTSVLFTGEEIAGKLRTLLNLTIYFMYFLEDLSF